MRAGRLGVLCLVVLLCSAVAVAAQSGWIEGRVTREDGSGLGGVAVVLVETGAAELTGSDGSFSFSAVPAGSYTLSLTLGDNAIQEDVEVVAGEVARVESTVDWDVSFAESITVTSASRRMQRITEAPAAVTVVSEEEIEREAAHGQVPKLLEFTPGAELTQSGLYDFNFNTRGFNSSLNRRVLTLVDGRDPSVPFLGAQEWAAISFPLDDLASVEFVRGPGSALYGVDAFNGVLNMVTKAPRSSQGGKLQLSFGDLDTAKVDFRHAGEVGGGWYYKLVGGYTQSEDFGVSRDQTVEYSGLELEPIPLALTEDEIVFGGVRFDRHFGDGRHVLTLEGGTASLEGPAFVTGIGRVQLTDVDRPWARLNYNNPHWNVMATQSNREAIDQISLRSGAPLNLDTERSALEVQGNTGFADGRGFLVGGVSYVEEDIDSARDGVQTLMFRPQNHDFTGIFGQLEYDFSDRVTGVVAARWDDSSLYDSRVSPRAALVFAANPRHTFRLSYSEAFQTPNYSEFFLEVPVAPAIPAEVLAPFEGICALGGTSCGFDQPLPILAVGNPDLEVEEVQSLEVGYSGILNDKVYLTVDVFDNEIDNFITDLIPRLNATLGNINPTFGPYAPPGDLSDPLQQLLLDSLAFLFDVIAAGGAPDFFPFLTNNFDGSPVIAFVSYVNFGQVESQGVEVGLHVQPDRNWRFDLGYAYFDFDTQLELPEDPVVPNTAENKYSLGLTYTGDRFDIGLSFRAVDGFEWNAGVFRGPVPGYEVVDLGANYRINDRWRVGIDVSNLLDDEHYEIFGGDILQRRALGHVSVSW